jgi:hypothetical protein
LSNFIVSESMISYQTFYKDYIAVIKKTIVRWCLLYDVYFLYVLSNLIDHSMPCRVVSLNFVNHKQVSMISKISSAQLNKDRLGRSRRINDAVGSKLAA